MELNLLVLMLVILSLALYFKYSSGKSIKTTPHENIESLIETLKSAILSYKKKISKLENEINDLNNIISKKDETINDLKHKNCEKDEIIKIFEKKEKILNEIFTAEPLKLDSHNEINNKILTLENFIFKELIPSIDKLNLFENEYEIFDHIRREFEKYKMLNQKQWLDKASVCAFIGKFSTGKSSIINTLLGRQRFLPVDLSPTTAVPTYIVHGYNNEVYFEDLNGVIRQIDLSAFSEIKEDFLRHIPFADIIKYFVVSHDEKYLDKILILDTPGITSKSNEEIGQSLSKLESWISEVKNLFWVIDINEGGIDKYSLEIIKKVKENRKMFLILNKADTKSEKEQSRVRDSIQSLFKTNNIDLDDIFEFSAKKDKEKCREKMLEILTNRITTAENLPFESYMSKFFIKIKKKISTERKKAYQNEDSKLIVRLESLFQKIENLEHKFKQIILSK